MPDSQSIPACAVPAGIYPIGDDRLPYSRPAHPIRLGAFAIGLTAVTNGQFAAFVAAGGYQTEALWSEFGWRWQKNKQASAPGFWDDSQFNHRLQPVVGVCWYEADAFARWLKMTGDYAWRLPTEVEWEAAARGPEGHKTPSAHQVNSAEQRIGRTWAALMGAESWCGAHDLCGNVWEWTSSQWGHNWQTLEYLYPYQPEDGREDLSGSHARVMRGGSWFDPIIQAHPANRGRYLPGSRASNIGFRLAYSP